MPNIWAVGMLVKFKRPFAEELDANGQQVPMRVLEINGDRCIVEFQNGMAIKPTSSQRLDDLVPA